MTLIKLVIIVLVILDAIKKNYIQYPHKVSGHPREAYAKTAFSLGRYGYNFKATFMKFVLRVLFIRKNTLIFFQIFSFTGSAVKKHLNSIRTAERTLCK